MSRSVSILLALTLCLAACSDPSDEGGIEAGDVVMADLYGSWYQFEVVEWDGSPLEHYYVDFLEPDPASEFGDWGRWEVWQSADGAYPEPDPGPSGRGFYQIDGVDIVIKREVCEPNPAANGDVVCNWRDFPTRIKSFSGDTVGIAADQAFGEQPVLLTRYDAEGECPIQTREDGWITASETAVLANWDRSLGGNLREVDVEVDSQGRPYVLYAATAADGFLAVASPRGCRWRVAYLSGETWGAELEIDASDNLHVGISTQTTAVHTTAPAESFADSGSWTAQTWQWPSVGSTGSVALTVDGAGQPWLVTNPGEGSPASLHRKVGGEWLTEDLGPTAPYNTGILGMAGANTDGDGNVHIFVGGFLENGQVIYGVDHHIYTDATTSTVERVLGPQQVPVQDGLGSCWVRDIHGDASGAIHTLCEFDIGVVFGENVSASAHAWWDGAAWNTTWLSAVDAGQFRLQSDGTMALMGEHDFEFDGSEWSANPLPIAGSTLYSASTSAGDGTVDAYMAFVPGQTPRGGWAHRRERVAATTNLVVKQDGSAKGHVRSLDGTIDCDADCEVELVEGALHWLVAEGAANSTFVGWDVPTPVAGERIVTGVGATVEVTATFTYGRLQEPIALEEQRGKPLGIFDNGDVLAVMQMPGGTPQDRRVMRLAPSGTAAWTFDVSHMDIGWVSVSTAGDVVLAGIGNDPRVLTIVSLDGSDGSESWTATPGDVGGDLENLEAMPGGGAAIGVWLGNEVDLGAGTIQAGLVVLDDSGTVSAAVPMTTPPGRSGNGGFRHLTALDGNTLVVADSPFGTPTDPGTVIAYDSDGTQRWSTTPGGPIADMRHDGSGGVWVLTTAPVDSGITCTQDDGLTGGLFRLDSNGDCIERWAGVASEGARVTKDGWVVTVGGGGLGIAQPGGPGSSLPFDSELPGVGSGVEVSANGDYAVTSWKFPSEVPNGPPTDGVLPVRLR